MPVRIYDIAKKLGIQSKDVLAKAKELGIAEARVASSSLDKITAEYLEGKLGGKPIEAASAPTPGTHEPVVIVPPPEAPPPAEPPAPPAPAETPAPAPVAVVPSESEPAVATAEATVVEISSAPPPPAVPEPVIETPVTPPPVEEPVDTGPKIGDKVGFIQLPTRPRPEDRTELRRDRGRDRGRDATRGKPAQPVRSAGPGVSAVTRPAALSTRMDAGKPTPAEPKFVPPTTGEVITLKAPIVVRDLAEQLKRKPFQLIADLMEIGVFANVNQAIEEPVAQRLCAKYGFRFEVEKRERGGGVVHAPVKKVELHVDDKSEDLLPRPPVVTIMGHVDHGKTTLLDVIRKSNVVAGEAGGITQHIGAYTIAFPHPERAKELQQITFLDTPGHAAFSAMRARGANVTDIVILVVAANDGVMPQTLEALDHARAAKAEIIVAVNKCDHPNANPMKVRQQLQEKELVCEEWGGNTLFVDCSALTKKGVDRLLEAILLQAEIMELKANPDRRATGNVIESGLEPGGPTATVLVRKGTLHLGDTVICSHFWGKVRALINEEGKRLRSASPSVAVKLLGLSGVPEAGSEFNVVENDKAAKVLVEEREQILRSQGIEKRAKVTLENLFDTLAEEQSKVLKVVVKGDTQGSVEAIVEALKKIESQKVSLEVIHSAVGTITESDVSLASASHAVILGFHTRIDSGVSEVAKREGIQIKLYTIIYELVDEVKDAMAGLLDPILREVVSGSADVRQVFTLSKGGNVAGCIVSNGRIVKGKVRVLRRKNLLYEGVTLSLRRFQDEVNEVRAGLECGIRIDGFNEFQVGDTIECHTVEKVAQKL